MGRVAIISLMIASPPLKPTIIICYNLNKKKYFSVIEPADITLGLEEEEELSCPR